jgi:hypothetical protein
MCVAIIARENAILARFRKRESFGWAVYPVYYGLPETRGVSETGHAGSGTVVHFGTPQHTAYPYRGVAGIHGYISKVISIF